MTTIAVHMIISKEENSKFREDNREKLLECLPKCSSLPKERHRWNTNEVDKFLFLGVFIFLRANLLGHLVQYYYMLA